MTKILFATNNRHKVDEVQQLMPAGLQIVSLAEAGIVREIPEPHDTLEANAIEKMKVIHNLTGLNCFSEDTGLEVKSLNGRPGVKSARFAGEKATHKENMDLLLQKMMETSDRSARFRTVIALLWQGNTHLFEGICPGQILRKPIGEMGFGYDPVFIPDGAEKSFAQMESGEKALYSHRAKALRKLIEFLV